MVLGVASGNPDFATPAAPVGGLAALFNDYRLPGALARIGAAIAARSPGPFRVGNRLVVARHVDVMEVLARDLEFRIAPINAAKIAEVNGAFVLGMDRDDILTRERGALYRALFRLDLAAISASVAARADDLISHAGGEIDVIGGYARKVAGGTARELFGVAVDEKPMCLDVVRAVFAHTFLNISNDAAIRNRAIDAGREMKSWFVTEIARRRADGNLGFDLMGQLLQGGALDDDGVRRTLGGMLVGSIDTTASTVAKIVVMLGRDKSLASAVAVDADDPQRLEGWCWEALRRWPHNPIVLRQAVTDTTLAGVDVKSGDNVFLWTQAAMLDASMFPNPQRMDPTRPTGPYLHFGGGLHPCAGRRVNGFQIPLLVGALVRRGIKSVGKIAWAGPFPDRLPLQFER